MALTNYNAGRNLALSFGGQAARSLVRNYGESIMAYGRRRVTSGFRNMIRRMSSSRQRNSRRNQNSLRRRNQVVSGVGVTSQHDRSLQYRKRGMPRYRKKRWKKFVKRVHAVAEKDMGSRTVLFNNQISTTNTDSVQQTCLTLALYSLRGTASWLTDMNQISALENTANPTSNAGETIQSSTKYLFQSGILDITVRNSSTVNSGTETINLAGKMEIDVYDIIARKDFVDGTTNRDHISSVLANGLADTQNIGGTGTSISITSRGCTPFECPMALGRYGLKIIKKTKYFLAAGDTFTYQMRDPKRHVILQKDMTTELGPNIPKLTRFVYIIGKLVPGLTIGTGVGEYTERMNIGCTRKYFYKIEGMNEDRHRYISASGSAILPS